MVQLHFLHGVAEDGLLGKTWENWGPFISLVEEANNFTPFCPSFNPQCVYPAAKQIYLGPLGATVKE